MQTGCAAYVHETAGVRQFTRSRSKQHAWAWELRVLLMNGTASDQQGVAILAAAT